MAAPITSTRLSETELQEVQEIIHSLAIQQGAGDGLTSTRPAASSTTKSTFEVFTKVRPLLPTETQAVLPGLTTETTLRDEDHATVTALHATPGHAAIGHFHGVLGTHSTNADVFSAAIDARLDVALAGGTLSVFCYGHTGAGKTYTMLGKPGLEPGLYSLLTDRLLARLDEGLALHVRFVELHNKKVYDLLDDRSECHLRENADGEMQVRGQVKLLEDGRVYAMNQRSVLVKSTDDAADVLAVGLAHRASGASSLNDQSSRSHGVLELEIVNDDLIRARDEVAEAEATAIPLGKTAIDRNIGFWTTSGLVRMDGSTMVLTCDDDESVDVSDWMDRLRQEAAEIKAAEAASQAANQAHDEARQRERDVIAEAGGAIGGKVLLVDLAGADKDDRDLAKAGTTREEKAESIYINKSLLALQRCITAIASGVGKPPFRDSTLTRVLAPVLKPASGHPAASIMVVNVSPSAELAKYTINSLRYGSLASSAASKH
ncbi:hypothetical protein GGF31_003087 [Allomyces arbusculus]|nr:hypothetical protein GGF31_003087 [Allomyces arbusculus]